MRNEILKYLGYTVDGPTPPVETFSETSSKTPTEAFQENSLQQLGKTVVDEHTEQLIDRALREVKGLAEFKYVYASYDYPQEFMLAHPAYMEYLHGSEGYLLCATTMGIAVDRRLKRLQMEDMAYAVVFDATAGVWIERKADEFEKSLPYASLGFRFCPGYQGTPLEDNMQISRLVKANKIGISFLDSGLMIPMKSMTGIVRIGGEGRKSCRGCVAADGCAYRRCGTTCYSDEGVSKVPKKTFFSL